MQHMLVEKHVRTFLGWTEARTRVCNGSWAICSNLNSDVPEERSAESPATEDDETAVKKQKTSETVKGNLDNFDIDVNDVLLPVPKKQGKSVNDLHFDSSLSKTGHLFSQHFYKHHQLC